MTNKNDTKWKDAFLRTSLPLEYLVAQELSKLRYGIQGEYQYLRPNEHGVLSEFSVDIWSVMALFMKETGTWGNLNYLIECKYCHPSVRWVFAPHSRTDTERLMEQSIIHVLDRLCTRQIADKRPLWRVSNHFPLCFKGVELHPGDATFQNIEKGKFQLVYGALRLGIHLSESQIMNLHDQDLFVDFLCPILVTTADLYVLKYGLRLEDFMKARSPEDVSSMVPALILTNPYSHLFAAYSDDLLRELHAKLPGIGVRLDALKPLRNKLLGNIGAASTISENLWFDWDMRELSRSVLVVNYGHLGLILKKIRQSVVHAGKSLTRIGILENDLSTLKAWVSEPKSE